MSQQAHDIKRYLHLYIFDRDSLEEEIALDDRRNARLRLQQRTNVANRRRRSSNSHSGLGSLRLGVYRTASSRERPTQESSFGGTRLPNLAERSTNGTTLVKNISRVV